jgi:hypothetical protein
MALMGFMGLMSRVAGRLRNRIVILVLDVLYSISFDIVCV